MKGKRMIFEVPVDVQIAIRIRAIKLGVSTGDIVRMAMEKVFPADIEQAKEEIRERPLPA